MHSHNQTEPTTSSDSLVTWILLTVGLSLLAYTLAMAFLWPYARPFMPLGLILLVCVFPPFFPLFLAYVLFVMFTRPPEPQPVVVVVSKRQSRPGHVPREI